MLLSATALMCMLDCHGMASQNGGELHDAGVEEGLRQVAVVVET